MSRRAIALSMVLAVAFAASGCLLPDEFDPTGNSPIGRLDLVEGDGASIRVAGWALDPNTSAPVEVWIVTNQIATSTIANRSRPDIAVAYPGHGDRHGFDARTQPVPAGMNQVCVWVANVGPGTDARVLGCTDVLVNGNDNPTARLEAISSPAPDAIRMVGWAHDPDASAPTKIKVTVDGSARPDLIANIHRPDVSQRLQRTGNFGFDATIPVSPGSRRVCLTARNQGRGASTSLGCHNVAVDSMPSSGVGADLATSTAVAPAAGHPLAGIDRDAGVSTRLRDGTVLWLFGDSSETRADGSLKYFVNNTAALSSPDQLTVTRDAVVPGPTPRPYTFATPTHTFGCDAGYESIMWPMAATNSPVGATAKDRVLVFFGNVCLKGTDARGRGVSLVEWTYDPATAGTSPVGQRIRGTVLNQDLFDTTPAFGSASLIGDDGYLYAYGCARPDDDTVGITWPDDPVYSGCPVARVSPDTAQNRSTWRFWNGEDPTDPDNWTVEEQPDTVMEMPGAPNGDRQQPVASFTIADDPVWGYTMTYSPWPGYTNWVYVRRSPTPTGPWTAPTQIELPGCFDYANGTDRYCYAANAQPWLSTADHIGIGYYDQYTRRDPVAGSFFVGLAPFGP